VLFDSRADKMMMKRLALPLGVTPSLGQKRCVTGVTTIALLDKEVIIEDMILPEFSATTCILGPICAIIMDNVESTYDLTIGMDLMQTLGIDIHNPSKTVVWDQFECCSNCTTTLQTTCFKQLCKTRWLVHLMNKTPMRN
jgi:hypothetical protein